MGELTYAKLRAHLIAVHRYTDGYFDRDYPIGGPITDVGTLRWLHSAWSNEPGHRDSDITRDQEGTDG
jgi:hypothetical protein